MLLKSVLSVSNYENFYRQTSVIFMYESIAFGTLEMNVGKGL